MTEFLAGKAGSWEDTYSCTQSPAAARGPQLASLGGALAGQWALYQTHCTASTGPCPSLGLSPYLCDE